MPSLQSILHPVLLGVLGTNELIIILLPLLIAVITINIVIKNQKKADSGKPAIKLGIILLVVAIALILIAQTLDPYVEYKGDYYGSGVRKNPTKISIQYLGIYFFVLGGIILAIGLSKKKPDPQVNKKDDSSTVIESTSSITDRYTQLEKLGKLKEQGLLTEEEFQEQKKKILG